MIEVSRTSFLSFGSGNRKSKIKNRKWAGILAIVVGLTVCGMSAQAQQQAKIRKIG